MLPYLAKIAQRGSIAVWLVDGYHIRKDLDEEFTNFGQHYRFNFIPDNEFWIDRGASADEQRFFIDHLLMENRLMKRGVPYEKALEVADRKERAERKKVERALQEQTAGRNDWERIHIRLIFEMSDAKIWVVNGEVVRSVLDIDFTEGGHDLVYGFVPKGEVWIDNSVETEEIPYIILHELHERNLMKRGISYNEAHAASSHLEYGIRHDPNHLSEALKKEMME